jgi:predicted signal transduction protein with EAL and GGDEF domain
MKWTGMYLLGYFLLISAALLALWKTGVLASIPPFWLGVGLLAAIGLGIMVAVANSGKKETIEVDRR